jgi:hypothetical protein
MAKTLVRKKASYPIPGKSFCFKRKEGQSHFIKLSFQHVGTSLINSHFKSIPLFDTR